MSGRKGIRYNIKAIPLGASVSFAGEESEIEGQTDGALEYDREDPDLFENRPRWQRAIVIAMGPALNFLTAFVVFIILFTAKGAVIPKVGAIPPDTLMAGTSIKAGDTITSLDGTRIRTALDLTIAEMNHDAGDPWLIGYRTATGDKGLETVLPAKAPPRPMLGITYQTEGDQHLVVSVHPDADRGEAGLLPGDQILTIEGIPFGDTDRVTETILASGEKAIRLEIIRKGKPLSLEISPLIIEADLPLGLVLTLSKKAESVISQGVRYPISVFRTPYAASACSLRARSGSGTASPAPSPLSAWRLTRSSRAGPWAIRPLTWRHCWVFCLWRSVSRICSPSRPLTATTCSCSVWKPSVANRCRQNSSRSPAWRA